MSLCLCASVLKGSLAPSPTETGLTATNLSAFRGERLVLQNISLHAPPRSALLLLGPNGSGKSTLLRVLAGLKIPEAGTVEWNGQPLENIVYLGHQDAIKPGLTAEENLAFAASRSGKTIEHALQAMDLMPLKDLPARMLSAGQKRRLALARLVLSTAPVWLLDEPTLGLDHASVARLGTLMAEHRAAGGVIVTATHLPLPLPGALELQL